MENFSPVKLSIVVPTFNESKNVHELLRRLNKTLGTSGWEVIFVDDDSPDGTASLVRNIARFDYRVRCLQRINRRGLSSAVIEGMLATSGALIAVMDADLQHDESILPMMAKEIEEHDIDVVVATRYGAGGSTGNWDESRVAISRFATMVSRVVLRHHVSDPLSGYFMIKRQTLDTVVHNLSGLGFKILLDILATGKNHLRVSEVPYRFRHRYAGESKLDEMVVWEYGMLIADKTVGNLVPVRFLAFSTIGGFGVIFHMGVLSLIVIVLGLSFTTGQSVATGTAMIFNFALNNILTYRDRRLKGLAWLKGLICFMLVCSIGAFANIGIASYLFERHTQWVVSAMAGVLVGAVWNYAATQLYTWGKKW